MNEGVVRELRGLLSRDPFSPFRIRLVSGATHEVGKAEYVTLLSWGVFVTEYRTEWSSFAYPAIIGFDSLIESEELSDGQI